MQKPVLASITIKFSCQVSTIIICWIRLSRENSMPEVQFFLFSLVSTLIYSNFYISGMVSKKLDLLILFNTIFLWMLINYLCLLKKICPLSNTHFCHPVPVKSGEMIETLLQRLVRTSSRPKKVILKQGSVLKKKTNTSLIEVSLKIREQICYCLKEVLLKITREIN